MFIVEQIKSNYYIKRYDLKNKKILYRELYPAFFEGINNKFIFLNNQVHYLANYEFYNKNNNLDTNSAINFIYNFRVNKDKVIYEFSISENYTDFQNAKQIAEAIKLLLHIITESEFVPELYTKIEDFDDEF